ncbi:mCG147472 [Mus musculus]|nr:mCG147472 [Mus musculus]
MGLSVTAQCAADWAWASILTLMVLTSVPTNLEHVSLSLWPHSRQVMMDTDHSCMLPRRLRLLVFLKDVAWI